MEVKSGDGTVAHFGEQVADIYAAKDHFAYYLLAVAAASIAFAATRGTMTPKHLAWTHCDSTMIIAARIMTKKPFYFEFGDFKTLPCRFLHGRVIGNVPAHMPEFPFKAEYVPPTYGDYAYELSRDCLHRASVDAEYAIHALSQWSTHLSDIGYFVQFRDDLEGRMIGRLHSHTELVSAILTERLRMPDRPLFESYQHMRHFRWIQEQYRADPQRNLRYSVYAEKLDRLGKKGDHSTEARLIIDKAVKYIELQRAEWPTLPPILNILQGRKKAGDLVSVFISYSHIDDRLRKQLTNHLSSLEKGKLINPWNDRQIGAGEEWEGQIDENLKAADVILLLISADFLASKRVSKKAV